MDLIVQLIEWVANDATASMAALFPYLLVAVLLGWAALLVVGYLRVSQVDVAATGGIAGRATRLTRAPDGVVEAPPGVPFCDHCALQYPAGALFCVRCEGDLVLDCENCGARIRAADESCPRCGLVQATSVPALPGAHA